VARNLLKVGAAQAAPVFFDRARTLTKTREWIARAGEQRLDLVVFPETYFAAYPYWRGAVSVRRSTELIVRMQDCAIRIPGEETEALCEAAGRANVNCVIGCNELDDRPGSLTLYNTLLFIGRDGRLLGRHRKLMPTHSERVYWGMGDGSDIRVFPMDIGVVGGLICYEHHMTLLRAAMALKGEEIHCAVWPGWWRMEKHLGGKSAHPGSRDCDIEPAIREYAIENSVFVISSSWYLPPEAIPDDLRDILQYNLAVGGSCIVNPSGLFVREPVFGQEALVEATIDLEERRLAKAYFDAVGHYARWDLLSLNVRDEAWTPTGPRPPAPAQPAEPPPDAVLEELANRHGLDLTRLKAFLADLFRHRPLD
jgi:amidase/nitrilase